MPTMIRSDLGPHARVTAKEAKATVAGGMSMRRKNRSIDDSGSMESKGITACTAKATKGKTVNSTAGRSNAKSTEVCRK